MNSSKFSSNASVSNSIPGTGHPTINTASVTTIDSTGHNYGSHEILTAKSPAANSANATTATDAARFNTMSPEKSTPETTGHQHGHGPILDHPTTYLETMMHLLRGNIGSGLFAMGDAFHNGGLILGTVLTLYLGIVCVHNQHVLIKCARRVRNRGKLAELPDFARTVELCFEQGAPRLRRWSRVVRGIVNAFICTTQIGFCCVYFVFASSTLQQVFEYYELTAFPGIVPMLCVLVPILVPSLITNLKYLAPCSMVANVCMATGVGVVFYYAFDGGLPEDVFAERRWIGDVQTIPLYFGTAMFAFEGIALVLPLKNAMKKPVQFEMPFGVLNVSIFFVTLLYISFGFCGYLRWGEDVRGSVTLNLPQELILAQIVKLAVAFGMCLTFALQFFVPIQIMLPAVLRTVSGRCGTRCGGNKLLVELAFRVFLVAVAFTIAILVPHLDKIISLIGALCATALALFFPVLCQLVLAYGSEDRADYPSGWLLAKNGFIMLFALFGLVTGTYESISGLVHVMTHG